MERSNIVLTGVICFAFGVLCSAWIPVSLAKRGTDFLKAYYRNPQATWQNTRWLGVPTLKLPLDMWIYQEILYETKPDDLVEAGTYRGGSAYFFASIFDLMNHGRVVTIDVEDQPDKPNHPRITYLLGSSTSETVLARVKGLIRPEEKVMVVLDSDHRKDHVLRDSPHTGRWFLLATTSWSRTPASTVIRSCLISARAPWKRSRSSCNRTRNSRPIGSANASV